MQQAGAGCASLAPGAVDVVACFVDLPPQRLPLFRREPALARTVGLPATAVWVLALLGLGIHRRALLLGATA